MRADVRFVLTIELGVMPRRNSARRPNRTRARAVDIGMAVTKEGTRPVGEIADRGVFDAWIRPHWVAMDRLARRLVGSQAAEDVLQEALAAAWRSRGRYRSDRGSAQAWLLAIVANKARDSYSRDRPMHNRSDRASPLDSGSEAAARIEAVDVGSALQRLSDRQRLAVSLFYYLGLTVDECAQVMRCQPGTVKSTLSDARRRLGELLGKEYR